jgi:hypothetical protein
MPDRPQKITVADMRDMGVRGPLIYCSDYKCRHLVTMSGDRWPDNMRLSDLEPRFICSASGKRGADVRRSDCKNLQPLSEAPVASSILLADQIAVGVTEAAVVVATVVAVSAVSGGAGCCGAGGTGDNFRAGIERAVTLGWLWRHESGTYLKFTDDGAALFA